MSVNIFKNGILTKIAGNAVALANNLITSTPGKALDASQGKVLNEKINTVNVYVGEDEKLHFVDSAGADTALPFSSKGTHGAFTFNASGNVTIYTGQKPKEVVVTYKSKSSGSYNYTYFYSEEIPTMSQAITIVDDGFSIVTNNSTAFGNSTGEYLWR